MEGTKRTSHDTYAPNQVEEGVALHNEGLDFLLVAEHLLLGRLLPQARLKARHLEAKGQQGRWRQQQRRWVGAGWCGAALGGVGWCGRLFIAASPRPPRHVHLAPTLASLSSDSRREISSWRKRVWPSARLARLLAARA